MELTTPTTASLATRPGRPASASPLEREMESIRMGAEHARQRRSQPSTPIEKEYTLQTSNGPKTLSDLFDQRSQLLVYHFMFGPGYAAGCRVNSLFAQTFDAWIPHLNARDVTLIAVSGATLDELETYRERMGWGFTWASSYESDFNRDLGFSSGRERTRAAFEPIVDRLPPVAGPNAKVPAADSCGCLTDRSGFTAFTARDGVVYRTYSTTGRGVDLLTPHSGILDDTPLGRNENVDDGWRVRGHDEPEQRRSA